MFLHDTATDHDNDTATDNKDAKAIAIPQNS